MQRSGLMNKSAKQRFITMVQLAGKVEANADLDWQLLSKELKTPVKTLRIWLKELVKAKTTEGVLALLDTDEQVIENVIESAVEVAAGPRVELVNGVIHVIEEGEVSPEEKKQLAEEKIEKFKQSVEGLRLLQGEVQGAAGNLVEKIARFSENDKLEVKELGILTAALASIQNAFFNKPQTNIQVNTMNGEGQSLLSSFRERLKS